MAVINSVNLSVAIDYTHGKGNVSVDIKLAFEELEIGHKFRLKVELYGKDYMGDDEKPNPLVTSYQLLHTIDFRGSNSLTIIPLQDSLNREYNITRQLALNTLNEDPGVTVKSIPYVGDFPILHTDEIIAKVWLSPETSDYSYIKWSNVETRVI